MRYPEWGVCKSCTECYHLNVDLSWYESLAGLGLYRWLLLLPLAAMMRKVSAAEHLLTLLAAVVGDYAAD